MILYGQNWAFMAKNGFASNLLGSINYLFGSMNLLLTIFYAFHIFSIWCTIILCATYDSWSVFFHDQCIFPSSKSCIQSAPFDGQFFKCILSFLYLRVNWIVNRMSVRHITNRNKETCTYFGILCLFIHLALDDVKRWLS